MKISIAGYSFHGLYAEGKMDAFGYLETVKYRYGVDVADFWNGNIGTTDADYVRKVREAVEAREMCVVNYHADGCHLWDADPERRAANRALALEHLRVAEQLGAKTVRIDTGGELLPISEEQLEVIAALYREYCERAQGFGAKLGPENHWGLSLIADNMEKIARAVDHPAYGILLHLGHWEDGDELGGDRRMAPFACHTHVDARITTTALREHMEVLVAAGYKGYWGVEHHSAKNEYHEVAFQLAAVRRQLAAW